MGLFSSLFGGGSSTSTTVQNNSTVNVDVTSSPVVAIDTQSLADAVNNVAGATNANATSIGNVGNSIVGAGQAISGAIASAVAAEGKQVTDAAANLSDTVKKYAVLFALGFGLYAMGKK